MALFKKKGDNLSRAGAILDGLAPKETEEGAEGAEAQAAQAAQEAADAAAATQAAEAQAAAESGEGAEGGEGLTEEEKIAAQAAQEKIDADAAAQAAADAAGAAAPQVAEVTDDLIFEKLSETLGREVKSYDDLKPNEVDPELAQLLEWKAKTGLSLSEWSNYNKDFSKMGDMEVAREILAQKYPNFTQEELAYELKNFVYNEDLDEEGEKIKKSIELKKFAAKGREALEAKKLELIPTTQAATLTQEQQDAIEIAQQVGQNKVTAQAAQDAYNASIAEASTGLDSIDLKLSDELTIKYNMPDEVKKGLPKMVAEMPHWYNEDGSYNHANVVKDVAKVTNFEAMVKAAYEQGIAVGTEGRIKVGANITIDGTQPAGSTSEPKGNVADVVSKITGAKTGSKLRFRTKKT